MDDLLSLAAYCRDRVNLGLFVYALSVTILHRPDTRHLKIPLLSETFPSLFLENEVFSRAREEASVTPIGSRVRYIKCLTTWPLKLAQSSFPKICKFLKPDFQHFSSIYVHVF